MHAQLWWWLQRILIGYAVVAGLAAMARANRGPRRFLAFFTVLLWFASPFVPSLPSALLILAASCPPATRAQPPIFALLEDAQLPDVVNRVERLLVSWWGGTTQAARHRKQQRGTGVAGSCKTS